MSHLNQGLANLSPEKRALLEARLLRTAKANAAVISRRDPSKPCRLSFAQEQLWFLDQVQPGTPTYNIAVMLRLRGRLDLPALERSLSELLARHEGLRTTFADDSNGPVQIVQPAQPVRLSVIGLEHAPEAERLQEACRLANEEARQPFSLGAGPLIRFQVMRLSGEDCVLGIHLHHIIADAWSIGVMTHELGELYRSFIQGGVARLPELPIQYADFAQWQRVRLEGGACDQHLTYWKEKLAGAPALLALPCDRPRPSALSFRGGFQSIVVPRTLLDELQALSRREGATLFMTLLAVFDVLLLRHTGQEDLVVGSPAAGRNQVELENIIGFFVNMLVLRTDVSGEPSFRELLSRVRETATGAFAHQDVPFEKLVEALRPVRTPSHNPLFQVALVLQNAPGSELDLPGLVLSRLPVGTGTSKFDLTLFATEKADGLHLGIEYSSDLFDDATIFRMLGHVHRLIQGVVANPDAPIADVPILTATEHEQLAKWNDTRAEYPTDVCLHQLFESQVTKTPDAVAVVFEGQQLTYRELDSRANQLARHLQSRGVITESFVGVYMERSLEMVVALYATLKAGAAYVPIDPTYPADRVAFMLGDTNPPVLLTQEMLVATLSASQSQVICVDREWPAIAKQSTERPVVNVNAGNLAYMIYTSGSTGKPKGAMNTHRGIVNRLLWMQDAYRLGASDRVLQKTPFSFDVSVWEFFWPLLAGARLIEVRPEGHRDSGYLIGLIKSQQITTLHFVPSMLAVFLTDAGVGECRSLRRVICSGEALGLELQEAFFKQLPEVELHNLYGPTEAAVDVTSWACRRDSTLRTVPIGRPIANIQIYILDSRLRQVPIGVAGELHIAGVGVGRGYHNRPELTVERFISSPFSSGEQLYKTGDLARYLTDGNIEYLGRLDHQVKIRGFRIELGEIEVVLAQYPAVREVIVVARENAPGDMRLVGYIVANGIAPSVEELRQHLKTKLPDYMVPAAFIFLDRLPLTHNGKIDHKALPEPEQQCPDLAAGYVAPRNETETMLAEIWAQVLRVERVGIHDNFFELGGHSLLVLRVVSRIRQQFGFEVPLSVVFEAPNIAELAVKLSDLQLANFDKDDLTRLLEEIETGPGQGS